MKVIDIAKIIEDFAPKNYAVEYDNIGLNIGDVSQEVSGILVAVDVTKDAIIYAIKNNCNMIISHHPSIFYPIKNIVAGNMLSDLILLLAKNNISAYSAHTNMDDAPNGLNKTLADKLGFFNTEVLLKDGSGVKGDIAPVCVSDLKNKLKAVIDNENIKIYGKADKIIKKVGIISGNGGKINEIAYMGLDCYITAEVKHSTSLEFMHTDTCIIEYSHYHSEKLFIDIVYKLLKETNKLDVKVLKFIDDNFNL